MKRSCVGIRIDDGLARQMPADDAAAGKLASDEAASPPAGVSEALAAALAQLDEEEFQYFTLNQIQGKTRARCAEILKWNAVKVERVRRRLNLHLEKLRRGPAPLPIPKASAESDGGADLERKDARLKAKSPAVIYSFNRGGSLNPFYRERLPSGLYAWSLAPSKDLDIPTYRIIEAPAIREENPMSQDLQVTLKTEQAKLARIGERLHAARVASETAEREQAKVQSELDGELAGAVLEEREANIAPFEKRLLALQASQRGKKAELAGAASAHAKQRQIVESIEGEIVATRHAAFLGATLAGRKRIRELIESLASEMETYQAVGFEHGQDGYAQKFALFPFDGQDPLSGASYRQTMLDTANAALSITHHKWQKASVLAIVA
jgi:hypothetical protein